jgi:hypothetical protein
MPNDTVIKRKNTEKVYRWQARNQKPQGDSSSASH